MSDKPKGRARNVLSMGFGYFVNTAQEVSLPSVFPTLKYYFVPVLNNLDLALIEGLRVIIQTFLSPLWGMASDRFSRKKVLVVGTGLWGCLVVFCGLSCEVWQLAIGWIVACLGIGALVPAGFGILADLYGPHERGKAIGYLNALGMLGAVIGFLGFGLIMNASVEGFSLGSFNVDEAVGWRLVFFIVGAMSLMAAIVMEIYVHEPQRGSAEPEFDDDLADLAASKFRFQIQDIKQIMACRTILLAFLHGFFVLTTLLFFVKFFTNWMVEERGYETGTADILLGGVIIGVVIGTIVGGLVTDWAEKRWPDRGRAMASQASILVVVPAIIFLVTSAFSLISIIITCLVMAFFLEWPRRNALQPMIQNVMPPELRGTALALAEFFQGGLASILVIGLAHYSDKFSLDHALLYGGCGCLTIGFFVAFGFYRAYPRDVAALRDTMHQRRDIVIAEEKK